MNKEDFKAWRDHLQLDVWPLFETFYKEHTITPRSRKMHCTSKMTISLYQQWKDVGNLPIECLVNMMLLYRGQRNVVQFDITYYTSPKVRSTIEMFLGECKNVIRRRDTNGNVIVYLTSTQRKVEAHLKRIGKGVIENAFRTAEFADMLDPQFYASKGRLNTLFQKPRVVQVLINVIKDEQNAGPILIQMCNVRLAKHTASLYNRFRSLSRQIESIDPSLQTSLTFHTKPGSWKQSPELVVSRYKQLTTL